MIKDEYSPYKIIHHPDKMQQLQHREQTIPLQVQIVPSNRCNNGCKFCSYRMKGSLSNEIFHKTDMLDYDKIIETLDCFNNMGIKATHYSLYGKEKIPIIEDNKIKSISIEDFVNNIFNTEYIGGYEEKDISNLSFSSFAISDQGKIIKDKITKIYRHKATEYLYEVILCDGRIIYATGSHSLNVVRNDKIEKIAIKDIHCDDKIACGVWDIDFLTDVQYSQMTARTKTTKTINDIVDSPELYRLLGYFVAEGSFNGGKYKNAIILTFDEYDRECHYINDVCDCVKSVFGIDAIIKKYKNKTHVMICSVIIRDFFENIFNNNYQSLRANRKSVPNNIWTATNENKIEFLRGLFCGDGNFRNTKYKNNLIRNSLHLKTSSYGLAKEVFILLSQLKCKCSILSGINKQREIGGRTLMPSKYFTVNVYARDSLIILDKIITSMGCKLEYADSKYGCFGSPNKGISSFGEECFAVSIKSKREAKELGLPIVYDITVGNSHRFLTTDGVGVFNTGGGDSLTHPRIKDIFKETFNRNIELALVSNGLALDDELCEMLSQSSWVRISIDAATSSTHASMRNISPHCYHKVISNVQRLVKYKDKNIIGIGFVVNEDNYREVYNAAKIAKDLGVDNFRISAAFTPRKFEYFNGFYDIAKEQSSKAEELSENNFTVFNLFNDRVKDVFDDTQNYDYCGIKELLAYIGADYNVYTCCTLAYNHKGLIGSIKHQTFQELWQSSTKKEMFRKHNPRKDCQHYCMYKNKNLFINYCIKSNPKHVNYI